MYNITKYIKLNTEEQKIYTLIRIILVSLFLIGLFLFIKELIFPTQFFHFNVAIDSLANTISRPYESKDGTAFHISTYGESDTAKISITLPKDSPKLPKNTPLFIKKSYLSFLSPINKQNYTDHIIKTILLNDMPYMYQDDTLFKFISDNAFKSYHFKKDITLQNENNLETLPIADDPIGFAPATLISSKDSIYVTDGVTKHPFQDERAFLSMGYNFDNVIKTNSEERSMHKKAKLFTVSSAHPFGTIFFAQDSNRTFIFDKGMLNKIPSTALTKQHAIIVQEASKTTVSSCTLKKTIFPRRYTCTTSLTDINTFAGNTYQFVLEDAPNTPIEKIKIKLFTTPNKIALVQRISAIKRRLTTLYK